MRPGYGMMAMAPVVRKRLVSQTSPASSVPRLLRSRWLPVEGVAADSHDASPVEEIEHIRIVPDDGAGSEVERHPAIGAEGELRRTVASREVHEINGHSAFAGEQRAAV